MSCVLTALTPSYFCAFLIVSQSTNKEKYTNFKLNNMLNPRFFEGKTKCLTAD